MDALEQALCARAKDLLLKDNERHPLVVDHNDIIAPLSFALHYVIANLGNEAIPFVRVATETLFALGFKEGQRTQPLDENIWNFDDPR